MIYSEALNLFNTHGNHNPFYSFWMGGYECSDKINAFGHRVDLLNTTGHLQLIHQDYRQLQHFNISTVREGIRWSQVEKTPYQYDWSVVASMIREAKNCGIQQIWDICHFGFPDDLSPIHPQFTNRFVALCKEFVRFYRSLEPDSTLIVTPFNEVSFLSWLGGEVGGTSPFAVRMGWDVKYAMMRAFIRGVAAMKEADPSIRILTTEPLIQIVPPLNATGEEIARAGLDHESQFQSLDMLCGRICPELGGSPDYLDILGFNFYFNNQWTLGFREMLPWDNYTGDPRWLPLSRLLTDVYQRYKRPVVLSETSHPGIDRPRWMNYIAEQCCALLKQGVPLWGVCLYPIIDRPDWDNLSHWHRSGLWDAELSEDGFPHRVLYQPYAEALLNAQNAVSAVLENAESEEAVLKKVV